MIIDDEQGFTEMVKLNLEATGRYDVIIVNKSELAIQKAVQYMPDLILLDIIMPVKDGFSAAEQIKKDPQLSKIPTLMLTSFSSRRGGTSIPVSRGFTLDVEDYISKPVTPEELLARVEEYLK